MRKTKAARAYFHLSRWSLPRAASFRALSLSPRALSLVLSDVDGFDVVVTTYEMASSANMKTMLCHRIHWRYLVLDEGHRIKNERTQLYERMFLIKAQRKLLLTGTPLQVTLTQPVLTLNPC